MNELKYRPDVDGLRAVAVAMVLLYHADLGFSGGFVGVDVFFVISGFLITGLILKQQEAGTFSLPGFWVRRIRRIIPASIVMTLAVLVAGGFFLLPSDYEELGKSAIAQQAIISNVYFWRNTGYFDGPAELKPLLHTWSLAVEEQFYLGYPFLLFFLARFSKRTRLAVLLGIGLVSFAASAWGVARCPSATFFLLPTRAWELLIGGLVCIAPLSTRLRDWHLAVLSSLGLSGIFAAGWFFVPSTRFPGVNALLPCGATAILIYANSVRMTPIGRLLAARPIVFVGLVSYSLYLWHWPILAFMRYRVGEEIPSRLTIAALGLSFVCAWLSWEFVETPFRKQRYLRQTSRLLPATICATLAVVSAGLLVCFGGMAWRFPKSVLQVVSVPYAGRESGASGSLATGWVLPRIGYRSDDATKATFLLWGDSHSKCLSALCDQIAERHRIAGYDAGKGGTPPLLGAWTGTEAQSEATAFNEFVFDFAVSHRIKWLILVAAWDIHADGMSRLRDSDGVKSLDALKKSFERTLERAEKEHMRVAVLLQPPYQRMNVPYKVAREVLNGSQEVTYGINRASHDKFQEQSSRFFASFGKRIVLLDANTRYFDSDGNSIIGAHGQPFYSDAGHLSHEGVRVFLEATLDDLFCSIAEEPIKRIGGGCQATECGFVSAVSGNRK